MTPGRRKTTEGGFNFVRRDGEGLDRPSQEKFGQHRTGCDGCRAPLRPKLRFDDNASIQSELDLQRRSRHRILGYTDPVRVLQHAHISRIPEVVERDIAVDFRQINNARYREDDEAA